MVKRGDIITIENEKHEVRDVYYMKGEWVIATVEGDLFNLNDIEEEHDK